MHNSLCINKVKGCVSLLLIALLSAFVACNQVDDDRIPSLPVYINLSGAGMWNTYGVSGVGISRNFINFDGVVSPTGFPFTANTYLGFGGVLLIGGVDPFTSEPNVPLAYDLACPVECKANVRVYIDMDNLEAVCPECGSHYDVVIAGGSPVAGPALTGKYKYGLRRYTCEPYFQGGYIIHN
ncbi:MAG: hypothetical protein K2K25_10785 [Muribaculaceae bacterium]|nr:hypothetical protein [Muribaculaceae bacterium]